MNLTKPQYDVLRLWVLGGPDAIFTRGKTTRRLIDSLLAKGALDKHGPTKAAIDYVNSEENHAFALRASIS